jgi:hypothetical protein
MIRIKHIILSILLFPLMTTGQDIVGYKAGFDTIESLSPLIRDTVFMNSYVRFLKSTCVTGSVGINTCSPGEALDIIGNARADTLIGQNLMLTGLTESSSDTVLVIKNDSVFFRYYPLANWGDSIPWRKTGNWILEKDITDSVIIGSSTALAGLTVGTDWNMNYDGFGFVAADDYISIPSYGLNAKGIGLKVPYNEGYLYLGVVDETSFGLDTVIFFGFFNSNTFASRGIYIHADTMKVMGLTKFYDSTYFDDDVTIAGTTTLTGLGVNTSKIALVRNGNVVASNDLSDDFAAYTHSHSTYQPYTDTASTDATRYWVLSQGYGAGTVTSISQGNGMSFSSNPITSTGTITLGTPSTLTSSTTNSSSGTTHTHQVNGLWTVTGSDYYYPSGYVGIKDNTPDYELDITGDLYSDTIRVGTSSSYGSFNINGNSWFDGNVVFGSNTLTERINISGNIQFLIDNNGLMAIPTAGIGKDIFIQAGASSNGSKGGDLILYGGASGGGMLPTGGDVYIAGGSTDVNGAVYLGKLQSSTEVGNIFISGLTTATAADTAILTLTSTDKLVYMYPHDLVSAHSHSTYQPYTDTASTDATRYWVLSQGYTNYWARAGTETYLDNAGDELGIGDDTPDAKVDIYVDNSITTPTMIIEQDGAGDANLSWLITGGSQWVMSADNSDDDKLTIGLGDEATDDAFITFDKDGFIGINTYAPGYLIDIQNLYSRYFFEESNPALWLFSHNSIDYDAPSVYFCHTRGSTMSPSNTVDGDKIGGLLFYVKSSGYSNVGGIYANAEIGSALGSEIIIESQDESSSASYYLKLDEDGRLSLNDLTPDGTLDIQGLDGTASSYSDMMYNSANGVIYYSTSSDRYKKNIRSYNKSNNYWSKILEVEPKQYEDVTTERWEMGYIAEEFDQMGLKDLVIYDDSSNAVMGIKYRQVCIYLIEVLKDHEKRIQALEKKNK